MINLELDNGLVINEDNRIICLQGREMENTVGVLKELFKQDLSELEVYTDEVYKKELACIAPIYGFKTATENELYKLIQERNNILIISTQKLSLRIIDYIEENKVNYMVFIDLVI